MRDITDSFGVLIGISLLIATIMILVKLLLIFGNFLFNL